MKTLKRGSSGPEVGYLQHYILGIKADRAFGPATEAAVRTKQAQVGFTGKDIDGIVGPNTQKKFKMQDFIVSIYDKKDYDVWFAGYPYGAPEKHPLPLKEWARKENADQVFNLAWFNMKKTNSIGQTKDQYGVLLGRTVTYLKGKGVIIGYGGGVNQDKPEDWVVIDQNNACGGVILAIKDKKVQSLNNSKVTAINANGILTDGRYFQLQSVSTSTDLKAAQFMNANYSVSRMIIQDGGGSVGMYDSSTDTLIAALKEGTYGRPVANVVCVKKKQSVKPIPTPEVKVCPSCGQVIK